MGAGNALSPSLARYGFSMIELLMVMAVISILFGVSLGSLREENLDAVVQAEAERLAAVLRRTRNRAIADQKSYAVSFNITNGENTSGAVLNNWDGGHWYQVIAPDLGEHSNGGGIPMAGRTGRNLDGSSYNFPDFIENVKRSRVRGEQYILPQRSVRFVALSDSDEGPRTNYGTNQSDSNNIYYSADLTYPRPWFGYFEPGTNTWWAWGGYDPSKAHSGFYYEGDDGNIVGSKTPIGKSRAYNNDFNGDGTFVDADYNGDGDQDDYLEQEVGYEIYGEDEPRALIESNWLDACIVFKPSGEARYLEWCRGRRMYQNIQVSAGKSYPDDYGNGVSDRAKPRYNRVDIDYTSSFADWVYTGPHLPSYIAAEDNGGAAHYNNHTGGYHITLAPDALQDSHKFGSADEVLDALDPAWRVYVGETGVVRVFRVQRRQSDAFLDSQAFLKGVLQRGVISINPKVTTAKAWPASPDGWQRDTTLMWNHYRVGALHKDPEGASEENFNWKGQPITDVVSPRMLTDRIWWVE